MKVYVPYFGDCLNPRVPRSISAQGFTPIVTECVNVIGHPQSYPMLLKTWFLAGDPFIIVEHDNESRPGFLRGLADCDEPWCFHPYDLFKSWEEQISQPTTDQAPAWVEFAALGHTKFAGSLGAEIAPVLNEDFFASSWVARDSIVAPALVAAGHLAHRHPGKSIHWHPYRRTNQGDLIDPRHTHWEMQGRWRPEEGPGNYDKLRPMQLDPATVPYDPSQVLDLGA